jgi:hypothetical protein
LRSKTRRKHHQTRSCWGGRVPFEMDPDIPAPSIEGGDPSCPPATTTPSLSLASPTINVKDHDRTYARLANSSPAKVPLPASSPMRMTPSRSPSVASSRGDSPSLLRRSTSSLSNRTPQPFRRASSNLNPQFSNGKMPTGERAPVCWTSAAHSAQFDAGRPPADQRHPVSKHSGG